MLINRLAMLDLFDRVPEGGENALGGLGAHVSALTGMIGEDLILGLLCNHWQRIGYGAEIVSYECRAEQGKKKLDAWVVRTGGGDETCLFKVEVKNWSFHSYGMRRPLDPDACSEVLNQVAGTNWRVCIEAQRNRNALDKVMLPMVLPQEYEAGFQVQPLLALWCPLRPEEMNDVEPFFGFNRAGHPLHGACFFSGSAYLRTVTDDNLEIQMPRVEERLHLCQQLGIALPDHSDCAIRLECEFRV